MLDQIVNLVKEQAMDQFINQTDVPNEQANEAAQVAGESIFEGLRDQILSGDVQGITNLLSSNPGGNAAANPLIKSIMDNISGGLTSKLGVEGETASNAASSVLPQLMQSVVGKFASPAQEDAGFDVSSLISMVTKEQGGDMLGNIAKNALGSLFGK